LKPHKRAVIALRYPKRLQGRYTVVVKIGSATRRFRIALPKGSR
jgi:hypothetical protein